MLQRRHTVVEYKAKNKKYCLQIQVVHTVLQVYNYCKGIIQYLSGGEYMAEFKAFIKDEEVIYDGPDEKVELFSQFLDEMDDATDSSKCDCSSNDRVRGVIESYFPDYVDEIMELFEDNGGYCDCGIGANVLTLNSTIKKLGHYMDIQDI